MNNGLNIGNLYATLGLDSEDFQKGVKKAEENMRKLQSKLGELSGYISTVFTNPVVAAVTALTALATASVAVGKAALEAAQQFQEATNAIRIGTGATGDAFTELNNVLKDINGTVAASMQDIGAVIADLNTAYGLQGEELEELSRQYLAFSQVTGMDVSTAIEKARAVFNKFGIEVDRQAETLDYFFRISQSSGVKMDQLLNILDSADRGFQLLGLSVKEAAAMIGTAIRKDGVEAAQELAQGLEMAAYRAADVWSSESEAQAGLRETLRLMQEAADEQAATTIGVKLFGKYSGKVAGAAQGGTLDYSALMQAASVGDTLQEVAKTTETLEQKMQKLGAATQEALLPIGTILNDSFKEAVDGVLPAVETLGSALQGIVDLFEDLWKMGAPRVILDVWDKVINNEKVQAALTRITDAFDRLWDALTGGTNDVDLLAGLIEVLADIIVTIVVPALTVLANGLNGITYLWQTGTEVWNALTTGLGENVTNTFANLFDGLDEMLFGWIGTTIGAWKSWITGIVSAVTNGIAGMIDMWDGWLNGMLDTLEAWGQGVVNFFVGIWNNLVKIVQDAANAMIQNTPLGGLLGAFGVDTSINLTDWKLDAPKVEIARSDVLKDAASGVRGAGATINQTVNITTTRVVDALEAQRGIERANRDLVRSGV